MRRQLVIELSELAAQQVLQAESWWRFNRLKAPNAIREELERASMLISAQPEVGARAANATLPGVRRVHLERIHYDVYYRVAVPGERIEILAFWHSRRGGAPRF